METYYGFEVDSVKELTPSSKAVLRKLHQRKVCIFETDDSLLSYETVTQLTKIVDDLGLEHHSRGYHWHLIAIPYEVPYVDVPVG